MARRNRQAVRLYTRNGYDFGDHFPKIIEAIKGLPVRSCFIDGEVIVVDERGLSVFDLIRSGRRDRDAVLCAFDLIELDGRDLRGAPIEERKSMLANLLSRSATASASIIITMATVQTSSNKLARLAARALCLSGSARRIAPAASMIG
jgi:bifunctional non-homologous end joining protein LigD